MRHRGELRQAAIALRGRGAACNPACTGCNPLCWRLQPHELEAATTRVPYVSKVVLLCHGPMAASEAMAAASTDAVQILCDPEVLYLLWLYLLWLQIMCDPEVRCNPTHPRCDPVYQRLQPHAPRLQPHVSRLQPMRLAVTSCMPAGALWRDGAQATLQPGMFKRLPWWCHSLPSRPPRTHGFGSGLLYSTRFSVAHCNRCQHRLPVRGAFRAPLLRCQATTAWHTRGHRAPCHRRQLSLPRPRQTV